MYLLYTSCTREWCNRFSHTVQIEACLNSRPIAPLPDSDDGIDALTPSHFLIGKPIESLPDPPLSYKPLPLLRRWNLCQKLIRHFWTGAVRRFCFVVHADCSGLVLQPLCPCCVHQLVVPASTAVSTSSPVVPASTAVSTSSPVGFFSEGFRN